MTREQAAQLLPIISAFARGEDIQIYVGGSWTDLDRPEFICSNIYRIKPKEEFIPYDVNTCPVGLKVLNNSEPSTGARIVYPISANTVQVGMSSMTYSDLLGKYRTLDGTPAGVRKES